ncbi:MAG: TetR/AcrR family transcriptional regulator [Pseudomonadales bacterium]|nr:TetR/AcrR family transcriptional regulator [Pseudomonadales bacterium]
MPKLVDAEERRSHISGIVFDILAEKGIEGVTIRDVAKASGFSKGVIDYYFESKDELLFAALSFAKQQYIGREERRVAGKIGLNALSERISCGLPVDKISRNEWRVRLAFWNCAFYNQRLHKLQKGALIRTRAHYTRDIRQAQSDGDINKSADPELLANGVTYMVIGLSISAIRDQRYYSKNKILSEAHAHIDYLKQL